MKKHTILQQFFDFPVKIVTVQPKQLEWAASLLKFSLIAERPIQSIQKTSARYRCYSEKAISGDP